ncbi:site-specific integrase [Cellulomonas sp. KRMCY2]|uniref:tyrosine-type recombinase/integrase n=1 Tax=Cellulomonas sp. KRMCY2 TaxID=1304865 RepID=UPI00045E7A36|nr:site-specific integrase [Cellulomonas sp. KRMCY2]
MASISKHENGRWRARYRDAAGRQHVKHFARKVDGQRWLDEVTASVVTGQYVAPKAGRITLAEYAEQWRASQVHRASTEDHVERTLRRHVYPYLGDRPLSSILPSDVQTLVKRLSATLAPATVGVIHRHLSAVMKSAVMDRRIASSPCVGSRLPKVDKAQVEPITTEQVQRPIDTVPERYRALVVLAAGTGMRQGEAFGLTVDRVDFLRRSLTIDRQLTTVTGRAPTFGPPKTAASVRTIPLPDVVIDALAAHLARFPAGHLGLIFTNGEGKPLRRSNFGTMWRRVCREAVVDGFVFHGLRHYYASLLIRHGESVKTVQARLGHANAAETLDTYSHLWPDSDDRTRAAVDSVLGNLAYSLRTAAPFAQ